VTGESIKGDLDREHRELQATSPGYPFRAWYSLEAGKLSARFLVVRLARQVGRLIGRVGSGGMGPTERAFHEIGFGLRRLARNPGLVFFAVVAMGLGIGVTATMFSVTHAGLQELPFPEADRLTFVGWSYPSQGFLNQPLTPREFADWRERQSTMAGLAGYTPTLMDIADDERNAERFSGALVSSNTFGLLGVPPLLGRGFTREEERPGASQVVILSHELWAYWYGSDPDVIGRSLRINGSEHTVVGVMPDRFRFPEEEGLWTPLQLDLTAESTQDQRRIQTVGRLRPGVELREMEAELATFAHQLLLAEPAVYEPLSLRVTSYYEYMVGREAVVILTVLLVVISFVLLVACASVANLLLARAASRTRELAVVTALGASRRRIMGQVLSESLVISSLGGLLGIGLAYFGAALLEAGLGPEIPYYWMTIEVNPTVLAFILGLVFLSSLIAGTLPALRASDVDVNESLKDQSHGSTGLKLGRLSRSLVVAEVAFSFALLTVAGLTAKVPVYWSRLDLGFDRAELFTSRISLRTDKYPERPDWNRFGEELHARLPALPGVSEAALTTSLPGLASSQWLIQHEGETYLRNQDIPRTRIRVVSPEYFPTLGVAPVEGRLFTDADDLDSPRVAIINQRFADRFFPGGSPIGRRIRSGDLDSENPWMTIVGVVPDLRMNGIQPQLPEGIYVPLWQRPQWNIRMLLRATGDPLALTPQVRAAVAEIDSDTPIYRVSTLNREILEQNRAAAAVAALLLISGFIALLIAAVGLFGILAFSVRRRTREIGIRIALGAEARRVFWMMLKGGVAQIGIGLLVGVALALALAPPLREIFSDTNPLDWTVYGLVAVVLALTGIVASVVPAFRAVRTKPLEALRCE
jgi:predicted permease